MATLSADITYRFDARYEIGLVQHFPTATDIYYRGGLAHAVAATGLSTLTPVDADYYIGVVSEHLSATTATPVWFAMTGIWYFASAAITHANHMEALAIAQATLFDNPADLNAQAAGDPGAIGVCWKVLTSGTDGWVNTNMRAAPTNA